MNDGVFKRRGDDMKKEKFRAEAERTGKRVPFRLGMSNALTERMTSAGHR